MMVILSAKDGKIITSLPLAGGSDGAVFNPSTMEAFSTHGNGTLTVVKEKSPTSFEVEQNLETMNGARTIAFDSKTNHHFHDEPGARAGSAATTWRRPRASGNAGPGFVHDPDDREVRSGISKPAGARTSRAAARQTLHPATWAVTVSDRPAPGIASARGG